MEQIIKDSTGNLPRVAFYSNGNLEITGRSTPIEASSFYKSLKKFVRNLNTEQVYFNIHLEHINSASSKKLLQMLKILDANKNVSSIDVNWYYGANDEDNFETAKIYEACLVRTNFKYLKMELAT